jgi:hypothetical protein
MARDVWLEADCARTKVEGDAAHHPPRHEVKPKGETMGVTQRILAPFVLGCLLVPACNVGTSGTNQIEMTEQAVGGRVDETLVWNEVLLDAIISSTLGNPPSIRVGAIVHAAMFDAYNGVERRYESIHEHGRAPRGASRRAAVVGAAYRTLVTLYPEQKAKFDAQRARSIAQLSDDDEECTHGDSLNLGLAWGDQVALDILAWRSTDGFADPVSSFTGGTALGQWRSTADPPASMASQSVAFTTPFAVVGPLQFRPAEPRGLDSAEWESDYNEVKLMGVKTGSGRTQDQTDIAFFYNGYATIDWCEVLQQVARAHRTTRSQNARLFALLNIALWDSAVTTFSAKRDYAADPTAVTWRPVTAIRLGETDGNANTAPDPTWTPLITTPNHPEYPASHPSSHGAGAGIIEGVFGDAQASFEVHPQYNSILPTPPGLKPRSYDSITAVEREASDARVFGGMHYRSSNEVSRKEGRAVAEWILANVARRVHGNRKGQQVHDHGGGDVQGVGEPLEDDPPSE